MVTFREQKGLLQLDGLTLARAVVTLVEATCLVGSLYLLGGSNHKPGSLKLDHAVPEAPCILLEDLCIFSVQVEPIT